MNTMHHTINTEERTTLGALPVTVLGSTGSVGRQTMDVAALHGLRVEGIAGSSNIALLEEQIRQFHPRYCAVENEAAARALKIAAADTDTEILSGREGVLWLAAAGESRVVLNSIVGTAGLGPTLAAIRAGKNIALANKETLVTAGEIVMREAREHGVSVLPVDSEHCAIFQCLNGEPRFKTLSDLLRRGIPRKAPRGAARCDSIGRACTSDMENGREDHNRLRVINEQRL